MDLISLAPPLTSKANYAAPSGSKVAGAAFEASGTLPDRGLEWITLIEVQPPALSRVRLAALTDGDKSSRASIAARLLESHAS